MTSQGVPMVKLFRVIAEITTQAVMENYRNEQRHTELSINKISATKNKSFCVPGLKLIIMN